MNDDVTFRLSRSFDAPRQALWNAWTKPEEMGRWWGPKGAVISKLEMDLRPGGTCYYGMDWQGNPTMYGLFTYRDIVPPSRLVFVNSFADAQGNPVRHPMNPNWPLFLLSTIEFEEEGAGSLLRISWAPLEDATALEVQTFREGHDSCRQGWGGSLDVLDEYLTRKAAA